MIRRILVDHARQRNTAKRGGLRQRLPVEEVDNCELSEVPIDVLDLDAALEELARLSPRQARVVELRFFSGLSALEVARSLDVSEGSVKNDWRIARAWLCARLNDSL
jgi:RNA polymerase sigma factor (TIGR02999 family)